MRKPASRQHNIVAICCYFNPCHYAIRRHNYRLFQKAMARSDIRLFSVELAFGDDPFELPQGPDVLQIRGRDVMWHKERLLQIGAEHLAADGYDGFVFMDADTVFEDSDWPAAVTKLLDDHPVGQCFSQVNAQYTDAQVTLPSGIKAYSETGRIEGRVGHAWAMRSEVILGVGLYQHCIVGGGDSALFIAAIGSANDEDAWQGKLAPHDFIHGYGPAFLGHYRDWADRFIAATQGDVGYADLKITALSHGSMKDRSYVARHELLTHFNPRREVTYQASAPFEWTQSGSRLRDPVRDYFFRRNEDSTEGLRTST